MKKTISTEESWRSFSINNISYDYECYPKNKQTRNEFRKYIIDTILIKLYDLL